MEAALWGRLDNAKLLMDRGPNVSLLDYKKNRAVDLAQPTRENQRERHLIAGGSIGISQCEPVYKEDTFNRDADRRSCGSLLATTTREVSLYTALRRQYRNVKITPSGDLISQLSSVDPLRIIP